MTRSTSAISVSRNSMWRMHACTVSHSSTGSSSCRSHRRPLLPNRSANGGLPGQAAQQHRVDLVLGPRPGAHQLLAARQDETGLSRNVFG
jgi:hypothetical protein